MTDPLLVAVRSRRGRNNKARAKVDERDVARIVGSKRFPADMGGKADLETVAGYVIQVKGGQRVMTDTVRSGLDAARSVAGTGEIGAVVAVDRSGTRLRRFITFDLQEWAAWHGLCGEGEE